MHRTSFSKPLPEFFYQGDSGSDLFNLEKFDSGFNNITISTNDIPETISRQILNQRCRQSRSRKAKKLQHMNSRIQHLEDQIKSLNASQRLCQRCSRLISSPDCPHSLKTSIPEDLTFEEFRSRDSWRTKSLSDLKGEIWIVLGLFMLIVGLNLHRMSGSNQVLKITNQGVQNLKSQIHGSEEQINFSLYREEIQREDDLPGKLEVRTVDADQIMFEQRLDFSFKHEGIILMMDNVKDLFCLSSWLSM